MSERIRCYSLFDISQTGVTNHRRVVGLPFTDKAGQLVTSASELERSRNQQRNFETLIQLFSLRTQPNDITIPKSFTVENPSTLGFGNNYNTPILVWSMDFTIDQENIFKNDNSELGILYDDCEHVPMILHLSENASTPAYICNTPEFRNICFESLSNK